MSDATPPTVHRVLVVDDDAIVRDSLVAELAEAGHEVEGCDSAEPALERLVDAADAGRPFAVLVTDVSLPGPDGLELVARARDRAPSTVPVVVTGYGTIESAVRAIRLGAIDYLVKPVVDAELHVAVEKAIQRHLLVAENRQLRSQLERRAGTGEIIGADPRMARIFDIIDAVATSRTTVLMNGESGTGKSMIARAIHRRSDRADAPFVEIACGSIPETLLESELFGHVKGAFTGAHADKPGRFRAADGGTLFLDEINSASPGMQLKLLRVIQERAFEPVGSSETVTVDVRVILASNRSLEAMVAEGTFRQDLYYRINVVSIDLPPLRERTGDIALLAEHFLARKVAEAGRDVEGFTPEAIAALEAHAWPGNARELENVIERAVVLTRDRRIDVADLPPHVAGERGGLVPGPDGRPRLAPGAGGPGPDVAGVGPSADGGPWEPIPLRDALLVPEREIIRRALEANEWNRQKTADALEINRTTLYKKMKQLGLDEAREAG